MKTSRICAAVVATLATFAAGHASAGDGTGTGGGAGVSGTTVVLNTYSKVWVAGDALGPTGNDGTPKIGKNTGAGIMDANFQWDQSSSATARLTTEVLLGSVYTRSSLTPNDDNSFMQGGFATAKLSAAGVTMGPGIDLPNLDGERTFMRPQINFTNKYVVLIAASEDNGVNNNPQPVLYIYDKAAPTAPIAITNSSRKNNPLKPTNLIQTALSQGIQVNNPNNQRGPHSMVRVNDNTFVVGMQYNNQAAEAFSVTVNDDASVKMNWLKRYSNNAQHVRPQVAIAPGATEGYIAGVEANDQPADIGFRLTKFNVATGQSVTSKIVMRSDPNNNKYVAEPSLSLVGTDKLAISWTLGSQARQRNGDNGHAGGAPVSMLGLFSGTDLAQIGDTMVNPSQFSRHVHAFVTSYGETGEPAVNVISGSSTGTGKGFSQIIPITADGKLGLKDSGKLYTVAQYADVANVQARGKRNPNNQAKGFINGVGDVPNPSFGNAAGFMPEVKKFTFSTVTGYTDAAAAAIGKRNSIVLSLVPAQWQTGIATTPGTTVSDVPLGPSPTTGAPATNPDPNHSDDGTVIPDAPTAPPNARAELAAAGAQDGCNVSSSNSTGSGAFILLAVAGVIIALRRKNEEV